MADFNAYATTEAGHHLGPGSTVIVLDGHGKQTAVAPIPMRAGDIGGDEFWSRLNVALHAAGWKLDIRTSRLDPRTFSKDEPGIVRFTAVPKET